MYGDDYYTGATRTALHASPATSPYAYSYSTIPVNSKLVASGGPSKFPSGQPNFRILRNTTGLIYFDKTRFIPQILDEDVRIQLQSYIRGQTVQQNSVSKKFRAYAVVIIGSRKILVNEMNRDGNWIENWQLIHETSHKEWTRDYNEQ
ncbi:hypothetical protein K440DRAFT_640402 [Wilcoxina mikolae CBS 423.85]|nr:hypothetical protein K440DRAFT_640402 [Wilcoxina mikolae CBS 423.85]